ncbi:signal transduction histidine kinase [Clostridium beijerinckii]|nr:signal transduction histidine kinase [Clostridium beijerinckii]
MGFDHDMMERIMLNLISNALKYSHSKGNIYVDFIDKQTSVIVKVRDEGKVFQRTNLILYLNVLVKWITLFQENVREPE